MARKDFRTPTSPISAPEPLINLRVTPQYHQNFQAQSRQWHPALLILEDPAQCASWQESDYWDVMRMLFGYRLSYGHHEILPPEMKQFCCDNTYIYYVHDDDRSQILRQWKLYDFDNFWSFISHYPEYESCVCQLQSIVVENHPIKKQLSSRAIQRIATEHRAIMNRREQQRCRDEEATVLRQKQQETAERLRQQTLQEQLMYAAYQQQEADVHECVITWEDESECYRMYDFGDTSHYEKRMKQLRDMQQRGAVYTKVAYDLDKIVRDILQSQECDINAYTTLHGNQLQHAVHQECIDLLAQTAAQHNLSSQGLHPEVLVNCIDAAREYNATGFVSKACEVANFCWSALECAKLLANHTIAAAGSITRNVAMYSALYGSALLEGGVQGIVMAVNDMVQHPIQTALTVVAGEYVFAYHLSKMTFNLLDLGITAMVDSDRAKERWDAYIDPLNRIIDAITDKQTTFRDVVKTGAALTVGWKAQAKLLQGCGVLYRSARDKIVEFVNNNPLVNPEQYMATAEGTLLKFSQEAPKQRPKKEVPIFGTELTEEYPQYTHEAIEKGIDVVMKIRNNEHHVFGQKKHKLDSLIQAFGGKEQIIREVLMDLNGKVPFDKVFLYVPVNIGDYLVHVNGRILNGIPMISTLFIK